MLAKIVLFFVALFKKQDPAKLDPWNKPTLTEEGSPAEQKPELVLITPYDVARREMANGVKEVSGSKHNPRIVEYHSATTLKATTDEVPWCASFVCWCLEQAGIRSTRSARAKSYLDWGKLVDIRDAKRGDIVVFSRDGGGHVAFFERWSSDPAGIYVLGGNQANEVCISKYKTVNIISIRRAL